MASTTSLLKSAAATRKKIRQQEDALKAFLWESSAKTRVDFEEYMDYLNSRLEGTTDPGEQLSYMTKQRAARRSFVSEELQREQMNIMQGTGSTQTKMQAIERLYQEAIDNEDYNLAQNLVSQWMSLDKQLYDEQVRAYESAQRLQEANNKAIADGYTDAARAIEESLANLNAAFRSGGRSAIDAATKTFLQDNLQRFKSLGVEFPEGTVIDIGALSEAAVEALAEYYGLAADALRISDPERAADFEAKAAEIVHDIRQFKTPAGNLTYSQIKEFAAMPGVYREDFGEGEEKRLVPATIARYEIRNGKVVPVALDTSERGELDRRQEQLLKEMGFNIVGKDQRGYKVEITNDVRQWFPEIEGVGDALYLVPTESGLQFTTRDTKGNRNLFTLAIDRRGLGAVFREEMLAPGQGSRAIHLQGQYGFDQTSNTRITRVLQDAVTRQQQAVAQRQQLQSFVPPQTATQNFMPPTGQQVANFLGISNPNALQAPIKQLVPTNTANSGVFWRGADGQVWVKGHQGTNAAGMWDNNTVNYWTSRGFREIADPNPGGKAANGYTIGGQPFSLTR